MVEMLNMLEVLDPDDMDEVDRTHSIIEVMRRAYRDRAEYLGDTDFVSVPARLTTKAYAKQLAKDILPDEATPSASLKAIAPHAGAGKNTTHFSVLDKEGNRVAATLSVNYPFGACFVVPGTGFLLNDEMDDFSAKPGVPNAYGLVGAEANAIAPNKRMLSSMSPTFLETENGIAILGTPGGSRIITMVLLGALEFLEESETGVMDAERIVDLPRFHHQYLPDKVVYEAKAFSEELQQELTLRGHVLSRQGSPYGDGRSIYGNMQAVVWDKKNNRVTAGSDKRGISQAAVLAAPK
jgi:gamma-glutamyltranspeptidase/glutathione hydrolase